VLPVETHATRRAPSRTACATPQVMPLSLKEPVGLKPWCLNVSGPGRHTGRRAARVEQRRVALAQRDHLPVIVQERNDLAIAPDAALIERRVRHAPLAPDALPIAQAWPSGGGYHGFQQPAAARAVVDDFGDREARAAALLEAGKFRWHEALL
jgi:hypothetical protein